MKFEKKFYTEEAALWNAVEKEIEEEESLKSSSQKARDQFADSIEAEHISRMAEEQQNSQYHVVAPDKMKHFNEIAEKSIEMAVAAPLDISIDTEGFVGHIIMSGDAFMIQKSSPKEFRETYLELCREAETFSMTNNSDGLIELSFTFPLCSGVPKRNDAV